MAVRRSTHYVALAGEFFVLAELAIRRLDAALTLGHTKEIDILVLNQATEARFSVDVKATESPARRERLFGYNYAWRMHEKHGDLTMRDLVYCFVLFEQPLDRQKPRTFIVGTKDVAEYIRWNHEVWRTHPARSRGDAGSPLRVFRIPVESPKPGEVPPSWEGGRWRKWENNWDIFRLSHAADISHRICR